MSVSLYRWTEACEGVPCPGDCDLCSREDEEMNDLISRQAAIDVVDSETVSTNPEHFKSSEKFIKFMDDADIASFGKWQWANGFNTALTATSIQLKKLPFAQPEQRWIPCSERLPEENIKVLVTDKDGYIDVAYYYYNAWSEDPKIEWWAGGFRAYPIAWMLLPEPYEDFSEHMNEPEEE